MDRQTFGEIQSIDFRELHSNIFIARGPVPKGFLAADLSGSESEDEGDDEDDDEDDDDLATRYPKRTYLDVPYTAKDSAKELGAKWDNENRKWYVYKINPHHDRLHARFGKQ